MSLIQKIKNKLFVELNPWFREHVIIPRNKKRFKGTNKGHLQKRVDSIAQ